MGDPSMNIPPYIANYRLEAKLGAGYSGTIWRAQHIHTGQIVALKLQHIHHECPTNRYERGFYPLLQGGKGMPDCFTSGVEGIWDYMALELLGPSLDSLMRSSGRDTMDVHSVCCIAMQLIARLETMHNCGILHRDIQLGNCTIGQPPHQNLIYMIDFGFSKRYIDPYSNRHIPDSNKPRDFIGNYWFSSVAVHCKGRVPSRKDDLEAAALMLIHLLTPRGLPWTRNGVPKTDEAHDRLKHEKQFARPEDLCRGLPSEFEEFLRYCRRLKFMDCPDYERWIEEFRALDEDMGYSGDDEFIWPPQPLKKSAPVHPRHSLPAPPADEMEQVLNGLTNMNLADRQVLGDRKNVDQAVQRAKKDAKAGHKSPSPVIELSDGTSSTTESSLGPIVQPKALRLTKLTAQVNQASDNVTLSELVNEFIEVLKMNKSRNLTKEGFSFLDALCKQLGDPSVFVVPLRTRRNRADPEEQSTKEPSHVKLGVVAGLKREVKGAVSNKALASMVSDFGRVTNKSSGRTVTKDGFAFLQGLADRLYTL